MVKIKSKVKMSMPLGVGLGGITSLILTILGAVVISAFVGDEIISETSVPGWSVLIRTIAAAVGAAVSAAILKKRLLMVCAITGGGYLLLLLALTALFFGGEYNGFWLGSVLIMAGSMVCAFLPLLKGKKGTRRRRKLYANR